MANCMFLGNVGCGKSTWLNTLKLNGFNTITENLSDIFFLHEYWTNKDYALYAQISFYASWLSLYNKAENMGGAFIDSSIFSHHMIFTQHMLDNALITHKEFELCNQLFNAIVDNINCYCVFLYCELEENIKRVEKRARQSEIRTIEFITELHKRYIKLYENIRDHSICIDITNLSPNVNNDFIYFCNQMVKGGICIDSYIRRS